MFEIHRLTGLRVILSKISSVFVLTVFVHGNFDFLIVSNVAMPPSSILGRQRVNTCCCRHCHAPGFNNCRCESFARIVNSLNQKIDLLQNAQQLKGCGPFSKEFSISISFFLFYKGLLYNPSLSYGYPSSENHWYEGKSTFLTTNFISTIFHPP